MNAQFPAPVLRMVQGRYAVREKRVYLQPRQASKHMTDWTFHPTLVAPFYMHFMGGNIVTTASAEERGNVLREFHGRAREVTDSQLREMLRSTWRPSTVAAWFIAYLKRLHFTSEVEEMLLAHPTHVLHLCLCLARLETDSAPKALLSYMEACAKGQLQSNDYDESITPEWAFCALEHLSPDRSTTEGAALWSAFLDKQRQSLQGSHWGQPGKEQQLQSFMNSWSDRLARSRHVFPHLMSLLSTARDA
jgi:hypothetical protein